MERNLDWNDPMEIILNEIWDTDMRTKLGQGSSMYNCISYRAGKELAIILD